MRINRDSGLACSVHSRGMLCALIVILVLLVIVGVLLNPTRSVSQHKYRNDRSRLLLTLIWRTSLENV